MQIIKIMQEKYFVNYSFSIVLVSSFYFVAVEVKVLNNKTRSGLHILPSPPPLVREGGEWVARRKEARGLLEAEEKIAKIGSSPRAGSGRNGKIAQQKG